jgi:hypothetical protein
VAATHNSKRTPVCTCAWHSKCHIATLSLLSSLGLHGRRGHHLALTNYVPCMQQRECTKPRARAHMLQHPTRSRSLGENSIASPSACTHVRLPTGSPGQSTNGRIHLQNKPATKPVKKKRGLAHEVQAPGPNTPQLWLLAVTAGTHTCCLTWARGHRQALARCVTAEPCTRVTTMRTKQKPCTSIPIKPPPSKASTAQKQLGAAPWEHRAAMHYQTTALKSLSDRPRACNKDALLIYAEKQAAQSKCKQ